MRALRRFTVRARLPEPLTPLSELVLNLRWSWHPETLDLFESIDPELWQQVRRRPEPAARRGRARAARGAGQGPPVPAPAPDASDELQEYLTSDRWYQSLGRESGEAPPRCIAYFSPEFGITETLPQYSGGLGILAGDHLKAASDLAVPIVGVGLLYRAGYFVQSLSRDGWQQEHYPGLDPHGLPLTQLRDAGRRAGPGHRRAARRPVDARAGVARAGRPGAAAAARHRRRGERPGGPRRHRPALRRRQRPPAAAGDAARHRRGPGAARLVRATGARSRRCSTPTRATPASSASSGSASWSPPACRSTRRSPSPAPAPCSPRTPRCPAGIDRFPRDLIERHFGGDNAAAGVPIDRILALGAEQDPHMFNMAHMGLRLAQRANGVSKLHGEVSRGMFNALWPGFDADRGADHLDHQRRARPDLGRARGHGDRGEGARLRSSRRRRSRWPASCPTRPSGSSAGSCANAS